MKNALLLTASALGLLIGLTATPAKADEFSTLEERMTGREFRDAGLHKLTEEELAALNRWIELRSLAENELAERFAAQAEAASSTSSGAPADRETEDQRGFFSERPDREPIRSRIDGAFSGWSGNTRFELENGMVWEQIEAGRFSIGEVENPEVVISPGLLGTWRLSIEGYSTAVRVRRVR
jgi:hypothetical protein